MRLISDYISLFDYFLYVSEVDEETCICNLHICTMSIVLKKVESINQLVEELFGPSDSDSDEEGPLSAISTLLAAVGSADDEELTEEDEPEEDEPEEDEEEEDEEEEDEEDEEEEDEEEEDDRVYVR